MKINYKKYLTHLVALFILFIPLVIFADSSASTIKNPLKSDSVTGILTDILSLVFKVGIIVVVFFIIFSGFKFVTARGNEGEISKAKDMFFATVIGGAILLGADIIATVVYNTVNTTIGKTP
jgi:hypothetical protein